MLTEVKRAPAGTPQAQQDRLRSGDTAIIICFALAAVILSSRLWLAQVWGSALPFMDEWDVEAISLYRPWLDGTLRFTDLLKPHNEHYLFLTRLVDLGFFILYDRWEPWSQIVLNAALHAGTAALLNAWFWNSLSAQGRVGMTVGLAVIFTATCGWQNALLGIQSQVYFSSLFAVLGLGGLILTPFFSVRWWLGWFAALMGLFCFAGGVLAALAGVIAMVAFRPGCLATKKGWLSQLLVVAVVVLGLSIYVEPLGQLPLHAKTVRQFYEVFARCLAWPHVNSSWMWLVMQLPLAVLIVTRWLRRSSPDRIEHFAVALAVFASLQAAAVANNRAAGLIDWRPLSRYQDPLLLGAAANCFAALRLANRYGRSGRLLAIGWSAAAAIGLLILTTTNLTLNLPYKRAQDTESIAQVRTYLATGDFGVFSRDPRFTGPHPNPDIVKQVLDDPLLRPVLPKIFFSDRAESAPGMKPSLITQGRALFVLSSLILLATLAFKMRSASEQTQSYK
jgi:hypothetical protein